MIDVGTKTPTVRVAQAQGRIELSSNAFAALVEKKNPKGDVLALSETAGIMAAKNISQTLPLCHPLPIEQVLISFRLLPALWSVEVLCEVRVTAKTGAEMEALGGVSGALLCIYDLCKAIDPVLKISEIRLNTKTGGKSGLWTHPDFKPETQSSKEIRLALQGMQIAVITVSDRCFRGESEDRSGPILAQALQQQGATVLEKVLVPDDQELIRQAFLRLAEHSQAQVIISTGGTGLSPRDVTPEAVAGICDRMIPGFGEALRADGARHKSTAWLSRSLAGSRGRKIFVALPGSPKAVQEGVLVLSLLLAHALHTMLGGDHAVS
jgi:molybdenum cofactor biosynthesis protein MoaC